MYYLRIYSAHTPMRRHISACKKRCALRIILRGRLKSIDTLASMMTLMAHGSLRVGYVLTRAHALYIFLKPGIAAGLTSFVLMWLTNRGRVNASCGGSREVASGALLGAPPSSAQRRQYSTLVCVRGHCSMRAVDTLLYYCLYAGLASFK